MPLNLNLVPNNLRKGIRRYLSRALFKKTKDFDRERLEDASLNALEDTTAATASTVVHSTGAHSNTTGTHGRVSIGVQAGVPSVHLSGTCDLQQVDDEAETRDTGASIGVDAGQQVDGRIGSGSFFQGGSNITVTGGSFKTIYGDFHELPEEFKRSVNFCLLAEERLAD